MSGAGLLFRAAGHRHGVVARPMIIPTTMSDLPGIWHASVLGRFDEGNPPAGGVGLSQEAAETAALGEALERYAAATYLLARVPRAQCDPAELLPLESFSLFDEAQKAQDGFPFADLYGAGADELEYTDVFSLVDNSRRRAPAFLVGLSGAPHGIATSSGLAAGPSRPRALLRALQELVERDALMTTWNHCLPGRRVALPSRWRELIEPLGGRVWAFDLRPLCSPHPVAVVCGSLPARGRPRIAIGSACRASWAEAVDKAFLEWAQGILFAGFFLARNPGKQFRDGTEVLTFEDHAAYYSVHPERWERVPLHDKSFGAPPPPDSPDSKAPAAEQIEALVSALAAHGIGLYYRGLTPLDLEQAGVAVVQVVSADLAPIHTDQRWPFIGGHSRELAWRYSLAPEGPFPNPRPHPLG